MTNNLPDATLINEGTKLPVVAYRFDYDGYGWDYRDEGTGSSWLLGMERNGGEPLTTITAANEAIEQAKLRPAPCARYCEAQAFNIELRQRDRRIAELEAVAKQAWEALDESRGDVATLLEENKVYAGYERYDRRIRGYTKQLERHDAALAAIDAIL